MENQALRDEIQKAGVSYRAIAKQAGLSAEWVCKLMAKPLSLSNRCRIIEALEEVRKGQNHG